MMNQTQLVRAVRTALLAGLAVSFATPVFAAETEETLKEVEVLGSRIKRTDTETASPVLMIDAAAIERAGAATLGDIIQDLPAIAGAATNPSVNNGGGDGAAKISLRGLGDQRTLLLVNGRRVNYNDVNSIPASLVQSVEVLKDGASAIYGSDAIGGVVNFTLKNDFEGAQVNLDYGISSEDDGQRKGGSAAFGVAGERGNFMVNLNYSDQEQVSAADRAFSRDALSITSGVVSVGGSSRTTTGRYVVPRTTAPGANCAGTTPTVVLTRIDDRPGTSISDFRCFNAATDLFNYQAVGNLELTPQERAGLFFAGNFNITDSVTAYAEAWTQSTSSAYQIAPLPFDGRPGQDEVVLSRNNIYNPFGVDVTDGRLRLSRIGNRRSEFDSDSKQLNAGVRGKFGESSWDWEAGVTYGKLTQDVTRTGYLLTSALSAALGPSFYAGPNRTNPTCGTVAAPIAGCVPVDFFGAPPDSTTAAGQAQLAALNSIATTTTDSTIQTLKSFQANFRGDAFETSAGTAGVAVGVEYRKDYYSNDPDFLARLNPSFTCLISSEACATATKGDTTVKEVYGEILVPLLADAPYAESLNLTGGIRFSDYDTFGNTTNGKLGFDWKPIGDLLVRGTYAQVFRAPTITDLFGGQFASSDSYTDPCARFNPNAPTNLPQLNIACRGAPVNFIPSDTQLSAILGGNPAVQPETGTVLTYGFVYSPEYLQGFSTTVDFWRVSLEDTIGRYGTQRILTGCATRGVLCEQFTRGADFEVLRLFNPIDNVGETDTNGVDLGVRYNFDTDNIGNFRINVDSTYLDKYDTKTFRNGVQLGVTNQNAGTYLGSGKGGDGNYSRWRSLGNVTWSMGDFEASLTTRYTHRFVVGSDNLDTGPGCADNAGAPGVNSNGDAFSCRLKRGANTYHNIAVAYKVEPINTRFRFGVDNVFDHQPPILFQNNSLNGNTDERTFDTVGRYFWITSSTTF